MTQKQAQPNNTWVEDFGGYDFESPNPRAEDWMRRLTIRKIADRSGQAVLPGSVHTFDALGRCNCPAAIHHPNLDCRHERYLEAIRKLFVCRECGITRFGHVYHLDWSVVIPSSVAWSAGEAYTLCNHCLRANPITVEQAILANGLLASSYYFYHHIRNEHHETDPLSHL